MAGMVKMGMWGGYGGRAWECNEDIRKITVKHRTVVDSLTFSYFKYGEMVASPEFGGNHGEPTTEMIELKNGEYLVTIEGSTGTYSEYPDQQLVTSITFVTSQRKFGPYGKGAGTQFSLPVASDKSIVGLYGRCGEYLDAIGVSLESNVKVGPWGFTEGTPWHYDPTDGKIEKIKVAYSGVIDSITINDSTRFGGPGGPVTLEITMEPDEYLITIRGAAGNYYGPNVITSLVFVTNKRSYAAFGNRGSNIVPFNVPVKSGRVIGFHGRAAQYLNAIGLVMVAPSCLPCTI